MEPTEHFEDQPSHRIVRGVYIVALWLLLSPAPAIYWLVKQGESLVITPESGFLIAYVVISLCCALGLFFCKEWARRIAIWHFTLYLIWAFYAVHILIGSTMKQFALWLAEVTPISAPHLQVILFIILMIYVIWPMIAIFYLTYPGVRLAFIVKAEQKKETKKT